MQEGEWRRPSLLLILRLTAVIGTVWISAIIVQSTDLLFSIFGLIAVAEVSALLVASLVPASDFARFVVLETVLFVAAANALLLYGAAPGISVLLVLFTLFATIYYDWRGGLAAGLASVLLIVAGAWGWTAGFLPFGLRLAPLEPGRYDFWIRTLFAQILASAAIIGIVSRILREVRAIISRLRFAEEKFSKAFLLSPDAMIITELESGRIIEVNDSFERLFGRTREETLGRTTVAIGEFNTPEEREAFVTPLRTTGSIHQIERQIRNAAGQLVAVIHSAECFDLAGQKCVVTIIQDITERKRAQAALLANEERFRSFIENAGVGIYRSTPDGRILMANPALIRILGYDSFTDMASHNLEREGYEPAYPRQMFKDRLENAGRLSGWEATWKRRDGTTIHVRESANVIRAPDGAVLYYDGVMEDISERKQAEQALRESEERFRNLTAAAFEGIVITENGRVIDINDQALRMLGYERAEMLGRSVADFVSPETRAVVAEAIRAQRELAYEHQLIRKDGSLFPAEAQAKTMRKDGRSLRMTALRDLTERRRQEQKQKNLEDQLRQMQKLEALGTLAGGIAHDFNNILTGILGNLQLAQMDLPPGHTALGAVQAADQASRRARDLVARILSFSRLDRENRAPALLGPIVQEAVQLLRVSLPGTVEIRTDIAADCPAVLLNPGQIHQLILNLGTNGAHAMREHGGLLTVELHAVVPDPALRENHPQVGPDHTVCLGVRDTGSGMVPAVQKRIFEPFYTTKSLGEGTGLGLAMVHAIMKSHEGAIVVDSQPGAGTTFKLYFPAARGAVPAAESADRTGTAPGMAAFGQDRRILLVDDEEPVRNFSVTLLKRLGFRPLPCALPADAVAAFRAEPDSFSAVITDLTMPEMTGLELARQITQLRPSMPVLLISGNISPTAQQQARASGVSSFIGKPFELRELVAQIRLILNEPPAAP
jgi:PAS domain S-box-containing protein